MTQNHRRRTRPAAIVLAASLGATGAVALAAPASSATPSTAGTARPAAAATLADAAKYPCLGYGAMDVTNPVPQVRQDLFKWGTFPATKVGNGKHDINWKADPYKRPSWRTWLHSLQWTGALIKKSTEGKYIDRDPAAIDAATAIAADWVKDNPAPWPTGPGAGNATMTRTNFLLCLRRGLVMANKPMPSWLDPALVQHAQWLSKNTWADHNVGTDQTLAMLGVGCTLGRNDFRDLATSRLAASINHVIDAQGANNEQSIGYAQWNHELWSKADRTLKTCEISSPAQSTIEQRTAGLVGFLDQATLPDGTLTMIGDTPSKQNPTPSPAQEWIASNGAAGAPPAARVAVYAAGYVFGRSGWGTGARKMRQESAYSLHYGPARVGHGHNDHMSLTWATRGRPILVDPGVGEYVDDAWRDFYTGPTAHNQLFIPRMLRSQVTTLTRKNVAQGADFFELSDKPFKEARRKRDVLMLSDPDIAVVVDNAGSTIPTSYTQLWHLPKDQVLKVAGTRATAAKAGDATTTTLLQLPVGATKPTAFASVKGATKPIQGWVWTDPFHKYAAPVASVTRSGASAVIATAIVAGQTGAKVDVSTATSGSSTVYTFTVGTQRAVVSLAADGTLTRLR